MSSQGERQDGKRDARRAWPVTAHIAVFAFAIIVPMLVLAGLTIWRLNNTERAAVEQRVIATARAISADLDRDLTTLMTTLDVLATSPSLRTGDLATFENQARQAVQGHSWYLVLSEPDGRQVFNTLTPSGTALPKLRNIEGNRIVIETGQPYVSDLFVGAVAQAPITVVHFPVVLNGEVAYVLVLGLRPSELNSLFSRIYLEDQWIATVLDRKGAILARSEEGSKWVGHHILPDAMAGLTVGQEGVDIAHTLLNNTVLRGWRRSELSGWIVTVMVPFEVLRARNLQLWTSLLLGGVLSLALSGLFAFIFGREIAAPIYALARIAANPAGDGFPPTRLKEANDVGQALAEATRALTLSEARFRTLAERAPDIVLFLKPDGAIVEANEKAVAVYGYHRDDLIGMSISDLRPPETRQEMWEQLALASTRPMFFETVHVRKNGEIFPVEVSAASAQVGPDRLIFSIIRDITDRKRFEEALARDADHIRFLMRELSHRSKNLLAVVQAMARQTGRTSASIEDFGQRFEARIAGLARSHDLLIQLNWEGVPINDLVMTQLRPFIDILNERVTMTGAPLRLKPEAAHNIGLALHELSTNASKYGSLSVPRGRIDLSWSVQQNSAGEPRLYMRWQESGGPTVTPPPRTGFGHQVIERLISAALNGNAKVEFRREGVVWEFDAPADLVTDLG